MFCTWQLVWDDLFFLIHKVLNSEALEHWSLPFAFHFSVRGQRRVCHSRWRDEAVLSFGPCFCILFIAAVKLSLTRPVLPPVSVVTPALAPAVTWPVSLRSCWIIFQTDGTDGLSPCHWFTNKSFKFCARVRLFSLTFLSVCLHMWIWHCTHFFWTLDGDRLLWFSCSHCF